MITSFSRLNANVSRLFEICSRSIHRISPVSPKCRATKRPQHMNKNINEHASPCVRPYTLLLKSIRFFNFEYDKISCFSNTNIGPG